ncbi:MAG: hypothetical protein V4469_01425 [Patescibacteria group bacterium]
MDYEKFIEYIKLQAEAHQEMALPTAKTHRKFPSQETNPYFTHPLWCSMMILLDTKLPESIRIPGAEALLFHDVLEDTTAALPSDLSEEVVAMIKDMTFENFEIEVKETLQKPAKAQLLKLYDKTATLYDGALREFRYPEWIDFTNKLIETVEKEYGELNIVILAKALIVNRTK